MNFTSIYTYSKKMLTYNKVKKKLKLPLVKIFVNENLLNIYLCMPFVYIMYIA